MPVASGDEVLRFAQDDGMEDAMSVILGSGEHRYRVVENWAKLPDGWEFRDVAAVAVDSKDCVYVFNRGQHPMMVTATASSCARGAKACSAAPMGCTSTATTIFTVLTTAITRSARSPPRARCC
jgi:hypothetical protein